VSRNRLSTSCDCGFWDLHKAPHSEVLVGDPSLMTQKEYFKAIDWENCPYHEDGGESAAAGYGYDASSDGMVSVVWRHPRGNSVHGTAGSFESPGPEWKCDETHYTSVAFTDRYRYRKVDCPVCRRQYVGWYVQQPQRIGGDSPTFELYDTSYWYSFNDEPGAKDRVGVIEWTGPLFVSAVREYVERHPELF
jgi:hypothetical protein